MLNIERHDRIREKLAISGKVLASDLASEFNVSEDTVRRDLRELARIGICRRVYGGALLPAPDLGTVEQRSLRMTEEKARLAVGVAGLIEAGQTLFVDAGSTNVAVAQKLPRDKKLTVVTNAPNVAIALSDHELCKVVVLGGTFNAEKGACLGAQTLREAQRVYADVLVLGTCGIDGEIGVTALDTEEAELKRCMVEQSDKLFVPATLDKVGTVAPYKVADSSTVDVLLVPGTPDPEVMSLFMATPIRILTVR
jgi:DeoR/GlpR family transcriptional regulator of sugar metabolism